MKEIFTGVWKGNGKFYTENFSPGNRVYGEDLASKEGVEYREWKPERSKLAAALKNGLENFPFEEDMKVLYLGAAQGTTPSHISDILKGDGTIYLVEFSERAMRDLLEVCEERSNMIPILADARKPEEYSWVEQVDILYEDVAQPDQIKILIRNSDKFLKDDGYVIIAVKARAIDVTKDPDEIYKEVKEQMKDTFEIIEFLKLDPWEKDHCLIVARKI
jgi:fibrillarin-like pre-rRNA processing protein